MGLQVDSNTAVTADVDAAVSASRRLKLMGYSCKESAAVAAVATFNIVHGATGAGGTPVVNVELAADTSETVMLGDGIDCPSGISIDWVAGQVDVQLFYSGA